MANLAPSAIAARPTGADPGQTTQDRLADPDPAFERSLRARTFDTDAILATARPIEVNRKNRENA
jgi:hypothetical protein